MVSYARPAKRVEIKEQALVIPKVKKNFFADKEWLLFLLFIAPNFFFLTMFTYWPLWKNISLSIHQSGFMVFTSEKVIWFDNYKWIFSNREFRIVLVNTVVFIVACVALSIVFGLLCALLLNEKLRGRTGVRALVFAPNLVSGAAIGVVWAYIFNPYAGLLAEVFNWFGISSPQWLGRPRWALVSVIIVYVWKNLGFAAVIFLAGLQGIPKDLYDAAKLDGANAWWRFRSVTLPMLSPITFFLLITSILATFQAFDIIQVLTKGGPAYGSTTLVYYVYERSFGTGQNYGQAAAAAIVLFVAMLVVTVLQFAASERRVHYDG